MRRTWTPVHFALAVAVVVAPPTASTALAAYDLSGAWFVELSGPMTAPPEHYDVEQSSGSLVFSISNYASMWTETGSIDEGTGAFVQDVTSYSPQCGTDTFTGNVAADGKSFTATYSIHVYQPGGSPTMGHCVDQTYAVTGSRCGNDVLDDDEDCDDGNATDGDCCSSTCSIDTDGVACSELGGCGTGTCASGACAVSTPDAAGTACDRGTNPCRRGICDGAGACNYVGSVVTCGSDGNECTDDVCGGGVCGHEPNTDPCTSDGNQCTTDVCDGAGVCGHINGTGPCFEDCGNGTCAGGACVISEPSTPGWSCDADNSVCTPDTCDGAGTCVAASEIDCSPCGSCNSEYGCVADLGTCDSDLDGVSLALRSDPDGGDRERLRLKIKDVIDPLDFGNPTAATDYTLCLYRNDDAGIPRTLAAMEIAAGGACGGSDCWTASEGFSYKDASLASDGIRSIRLDPSKGITIVGSRSGLPLPPSLFTSSLLPITPKVVARDGSTTNCWYHAVAPGKVSETKFKGRYSAD